MKLKNVIKYLNNINKELSENISYEDKKIIDFNLNSINKKKKFDLYYLLNNNNDYTYDHFILLFTKYIIYLIVSNNNSIDYTIILNQLDNETQFIIINNANEIIHKMGLNHVTNLTPNHVTNLTPNHVTNLTPTSNSAFNSSAPFDIMKIIDEYIASFTLEELLMKPDFILDKNKVTRNSNVLVRNIIDKTKSDIILSDDDDNADYDYTNINKTNTSSKLTGMEIFNQKKIFYDIITTFISKTLLDNESELIFNFQYLVNNFFNKILEKYKEEYKYNKDDIFFVYKGGTSMKILYEKYNKLFNTSPALFNKLQDMFSRSDSDYGLYITKDFDEEKYNNVYYDLFIINYNILNKIKLFLNDKRYTNYILPLNKEKHINKNNVLNIIGKMNETLNNNNLKLFENVEKFIAITINDETYISDSDNQQFLQDINMNDFKIYYLNASASSSNLNSKFSLNTTSKRKDFYITWNDETKINSSRKLGYINETTNYIFHTINDNIYYKASDTDNNFSLQRIKLNTILYFKIKGSNTYGRMNCPSEIIDVSLSSFRDFKINRMNLKNDLKEYIFKDTLNTNKAIQIFSFSLYGFIEDILFQFTERILIWETVKYDKKLNRIILLLCVYLFNEKKIKIISSIIDIINELLTNNTSNLDNIKNKIETINDKLVKELLTIILNNKLIVNNTNNNEYTNQFKKLSALIIDTFNIFLKDLKKISPNINTGYYDIPESIPYLKKYLKYKQKYLDLLKKN